MIYSEQYKEHIEYTFSAFCKIVLRNAAISAYRDFGRKQKHEVSLDYLMSETPFEPFTTDSYFEQYDKPTVFVVKGQKDCCGKSRSTVNYWKHAALKQLRKEWLKSEHEKQEADTL